MFGPGVIQDPRAGLQRGLRDSSETARQRRLHGGHGVRDVLIVPVTEQVLHHRIVAVDELDDQVRPESSQLLDQFDQRNGTVDDQMVHEGETQDELG